MSTSSLPPAFETALTALREIADPEEQARAATAALAAVPEFHAALRGVRQESFQRLNKTMTGDQMATLLGLSAPRVSQILRGVTKNKRPAPPAVERMVDDA
ncbi:RNA polymerase subunit sigma-70 [Streptomyces sp. NBC_01207]|uniref:RNA polymerase subunit sigma-70 n=1 Tax=Streptomyces sp. NBC_01207 TaxID=2903772 RepID=UPI002E10A9E9|nr:RNA polymerase subunit sigma-70 [Streptomyces sp. NBC_01207]